MAAAPRPATLILAGGLALGAYQAGALGVLLGSGLISLEAVAGSSMGAIHAAILAGNPPETRRERLAAFWEERATEIAPRPLAWLDPLGMGEGGQSLRHARNWLNAATVRLAGVRGLFGPQPGAAGKPSEVSSLYETNELAGTLARYVDFDRLNTGPLRCCIATTDVETAETFVFDTAAGDRIGPEHVMASGALLPSFSPVRIGGRLLADGGLSANAPLEPFLATDARMPVPPLAILLDLFAPDAPPPIGLEAAAARATDMQFAAQTQLRLQALVRERAAAEAPGIDLLHLSYRPLPGDAGPEKQFDFSRATIADRMAEGARDAEGALARLDGLGAGEGALRIHRIRAAAPC